MKQNGSKALTAPEFRVHGKEKDASFQVIVLGNSGGPREDNVTGLLVRAPQTEWRKGSVIAVDAGAHLASIIRILQREMPRSSQELPEPGYRQELESGPFTGIKFPHISAKANALYVFRELLHSVLITHPHLDHLSGIAINTPALEYGREAKAIYGLPSTIDAIKNHIFNDWIWPNLSDEGHGVGFVTFRRLIEGGNPRLGSGDARGYINVCDGLATKCWSLSHGKCHRRSHSVSHQRGESFGWGGNDYNFSSRRMSRMSDDHGYFAAYEQHHRHNPAAYPPGAPPQMPPPTPGVHTGSQPASAVEGGHLFEPVSSSAFFIRNDEDGKELLIFGDVEPDSVSLAPRNHIIWDDAAAKFVHGSLKAIFIECSYDDSVRNEDLYGHLCPRHLIAELAFLAHSVMQYRKHVATSKDTTDPVQPEITPSQQTQTQAQAQTPVLEAKRKRKRATPNLNNGDLPTTTTPDLKITDFSSPPSPPQQSGYVGSGARSTSSTRRKVSHPHTVTLPVSISVSASALEGPGSVSDRPSSSSSRPGTPRGGSSAAKTVQFQAPENPSVNLPSGGLGSTSPNPHAPHISTNATITTTAADPTALLTVPTKEKLPAPLAGLTVHVIHVKDTLMDGPSPGEIILGQLRNLGEESGLGVEFDVCTFGESIWV